MDEAVIGDWRRKRQRYVAWWKRELGDALISINAKRDKPAFPPPEVRVPGDAVGRWCDVEYAVAAALHGAATVYYGGDSLPIGWPNLGCVDLGGFAGAELGFAPDTVWINECIDDLDAYRPPRFDRSNRYVRLVEERTAALLAAAEGRYFVTMASLIDPVTALSQMRGVEAFCLDMRDRPQRVRVVRDAFTQLWLDAYDHFYGMMTAAGQDGVRDWVGLWGPGRYKCTECDFSVMVSPADFRWLIAPDQDRLWSRLDEAAFHLDGPQAARHLDDLLAMDRLGAIQWVPGAGQPSEARHWIDLAQKILEAGKNLVLYAEHDELEYLLERLPHRGLALMLPDATGEDHARSILRSAHHPLA